jgi:5-methylcytosine-specific restriction enzyme subunit McrC
LKGNENSLVLDTKWKLLDARDNNGSDKYGLSQNDFYQMFAYAHKYLEGDNRNLILIYPKTDKFSEAIKHSFDFSDEIKLWVVPFDVTAGAEDIKRFKLPSEVDIQNLKKVEP